MNRYIDPLRVRRKFFILKTGQVSDQLVDVSGKSNVNLTSLYIYIMLCYIIRNLTLFEVKGCLTGGKNHQINNGQIETGTANFELHSMMLLNETEHELYRIGKIALIESVSKSCGTLEELSIPKRVGLVSRAILAATIECRGGAFHPYTFGTPNTYDFEIERHVTQVSRARHVSCDLTSIELTLNDLIETSKSTDCNMGVFNIAFLNCTYKDLGDSGRYFVGFLGGSLRGSQTKVEPSRSLQKAKKEFIIKETTKLFLILHIRVDELTKFLTSYNLLGSLDFDEQVDYSNRQERYVSAQLFFPNIKYATPLAGRNCIEFILNIGTAKYTHSLSFYFSILMSSFATLFNIRNKRQNTTLKHKILNRLSVKFLGKTNPHINYINHSRFLSSYPKIRAIITKLDEQMLNSGLRKALTTKFPELDKILHLSNRNVEIMIRMASFHIYMPSSKVYRW